MTDDKFKRTLHTLTWACGRKREWRGPKCCIQKNENKMYFHSWFWQVRGQQHHLLDLYFSLIGSLPSVSPCTFPLFCLGMSKCAGPGQNLAMCKWLFLPCMLKPNIYHVKSLPLSFNRSMHFQWGRIVEIAKSETLEVGEWGTGKFSPVKRQLT